MIFPITQGAFSTSKTLELPEGAVMALSQLQVSSSHPLLWMITPFITTKISGISGFNHQKTHDHPIKTTHEKPSITMNKSH